MNNKEFIKYVKQECKKHNIKCVLKNIKSLKLNNNIKCSGYFDEENLVVAMKHPDAIQILVHEYGHLTQWEDQCPIWIECGKNKSLEKLEMWLNGDKISNIKKHISLCRSLELDNEKRSVKLIQKFNLKINTGEYIKKANAYIQFYNYLTISRKWGMPKNAPYTNKLISKLMPNTFSMNYNTLSKKMYRIFEEQKV